MPHVTTFRFTVKPGEREQVIELFRNWQAERAPVVTGFVRSVLASNIENPEELQAAVIFDTTGNYNANSAAEETDNWFQQLRAHLIDDPVWFNGNVELEVGG